MSALHAVNAASFGHRPERSLFDGPEQMTGGIAPHKTFLAQR
jgi:hypothetical protein